MRKSFAVTGAALIAMLSTVAQADEATFVAKRGQMVYSSDNHRIGHIDKIEKQRAGIIVDTRYVYVPLDSLSPGEKSRVVTKLTYKEVTAN